MKKKNILIIIPAYNESKSIEKVCESLEKYKYDYVVINDCSTDETGKICQKKGYNCINLVHNLGIGGAVQTGYKYAKLNNYDIAVQFDGDGQHNSEYIKDLTDPIINNDMDMVIGSRFVRKINTFKSSFTRRLGIKLISFFIKLVTGEKIYDTTSGMRAVNKKIIDEFSENYPTEYPEPISTTLMIKKGYKVLEKPVKMNERKEGISSIRAWKNIYYMVNVVLSIILIGFRRIKK